MSDDKGPIELDAAIIRVFPEHVSKLWPQLEPLLSRALRATPTHVPDDVRRALLGMACHLWIQWRDRVECFIITEFVNYPQGVWLRVWLGASAPGAKMDDDAFFEELEKFREAAGCRGYELIGRHGWMKKLGSLFEPDAIRVEGLVLRVTI